MESNEKKGPDAQEERIDLWKSYLLRRQELTAGDVDELEDHLRGHLASLADKGLSPEEAFMVAVRRIGELDALTREFAIEHSDRLWKQLVIAPEGDDESRRRDRREPLVMLALAVAAALSFKVPALFGYELEDEFAPFYTRNISFFVLPYLFGYFAWKRGLGRRAWLVAAGVFAVAAAFMNSYPYDMDSHTSILATMHLPIGLWMVIGLAYTGGRWTDGAARMNFIRYTGELVIYFVLIALGGGVLTAFTLFSFQAIGLNAEWLAQRWLLPCGALGAIIVASWLVEAKQSVIENMAPVLTRVFTPLFAMVQVTLLGTMIWTRRFLDMERDVLIGFDLLLVLVLGLLLYAVSARDKLAPPGLFDILQLVLVISALVLNALALTAIAARISEYGFSPNKVAALGENLILLVNLAWSAWLYLKFLRRRGQFAELERWQTAYLPVFGMWAFVVVIVFPPLFGFV